MLFLAFLTVLTTLPNVVFDVPDVVDHGIRRGV